MFEVQDTPKIPLKSVQKSTSKQDPLKFVNFQFLEPPGQAQEPKRPPLGSPKEGQSGAKTVKNEVQERLEMLLVSKRDPKWLRWPLEGAF